MVVSVMSMAAWRQDSGVPRAERNASSEAAEVRITEQSDFRNGARPSGQVLQSFDGSDRSGTTLKRHCAGPRQTSASSGRKLLNRRGHNSLAARHTKKCESGCVWMTVVVQWTDCDFAFVE